MTAENMLLAEDLIKATLTATTIGGVEGAAGSILRTRALERVSRALSAGADPSLSAKCPIAGSKTSALVLAAAKNDVECLRLLAASPHADLDRLDPNGYTALLAAAHFGGAEAVRILLSAGADPNIAGLNGWNALMSAIWSVNYESCAELVPLTNLEHLTLQGKDVHDLASADNGDFRAQIQGLLASQAEANALAKSCSDAPNARARQPLAL